MARSTGHPRLRGAFSKKKGQHAFAAQLACDLSPRMDNQLRRPIQCDIFAIAMQLDFDPEMISGAL
jgi:hypothetical protein